MGKNQGEWKKIGVGGKNIFPMFCVLSQNFCVPSQNFRVPSRNFAFCRYLNITKVVDLNVKTVFSRRNCSYREKIPHLVNVSGQYYGVRASG